MLDLKIASLISYGEKIIFILHKPYLKTRKRSPITIKETCTSAYNSHLIHPQSMTSFMDDHFLLSYSLGSRLRAAVERALLHASGDWQLLRGRIQGLSSSYTRSFADSLRKIAFFAYHKNLVKRSSFFTGVGVKLGCLIPVEHEAEDDPLRHHLLLAERALRCRQLGLLSHPLRRYSGNDVTVFIIDITLFSASAVSDP